jgi:chromosomal replication initiator protein
MVHSNKQSAEVTKIQSLVSSATGIKVSEILSKSRKAEIVRARHISMYLCRWNTSINLLNIAIQHGRDNHATVIHACSCIQNDIRTNKKVAEIVSQLESTLKTK